MLCAGAAAGISGLPAEEGLVSSGIDLLSFRQKAGLFIDVSGGH
jgi:hypothetical protein